MSDSRYDSLARVLTTHSTKLKAGERVLIDVADTPEEFVIALIRAARAAKAEPHVVMHSGRISRELALVLLVLRLKPWPRSISLA